MLTLQDFHLIIGIGWEDQWDDRLNMTFHEQEDGFSEEITFSCKCWFHRMKLRNPIRTVHLPQTLSFKLSDLRTLFRKFVNGYKDINAVLPLEFNADGFEVMNGPARGTKVLTTKR